MIDSGAGVLFDGGIRRNPQILLWGREGGRGGERGIRNLPRENAATSVLDRETVNRKNSRTVTENIQIKKR